MLKPYRLLLQNCRLITQLYLASFFSLNSQMGIRVSTLDLLLQVELVKHDTVEANIKNLSVFCFGKNYQSVFISSDLRFQNTVRWGFYRGKRWSQPIIKSMGLQNLLAVSTDENMYFKWVNMCSCCKDAAILLFWLWRKYICQCFKHFSNRIMCSTDFAWLSNLLVMDPSWSFWAKPNYKLSQAELEFFKVRAISKLKQSPKNKYVLSFSIWQAINNS